MFDRPPLALMVLAACSGAEEPRDSSPHDTGGGDTDTASDTAAETGDTDTTTFTGTARVVDMGTEADAKVLGEAMENDIWGLRVGRGGDVNNDGYADLLLSTPSYSGPIEQAGRGYILYGPVAGTLQLSAADVILDAAPSTLLGKSISAAGDLNGDGLDDLAIGQDGYADESGDAGRAVILFGPVTTSGDVQDVGSTFLVGESEDYGSNAGANVGPAGDVNDDGVDDLVVGFWGLKYSISLGGGYVVYGPLSPGEFQLRDAAAMRITDATHGGDIAAAGDTNGDGFDDVILGASYDDPAALLYYGPTVGDVTRADADLTYYTSAGEVGGQGPVSGGDINGDGYDDLLIDEDTHDESGESSGAVFIEYGPTSIGRVDLTESDARLLGFRERMFAGYDVDGPGDVNGDGFADILVGAPEYTAQTKAGWAFLALGPVSGSTSLADSALAFRPNGNDEEVGVSLAGAGDVDGDGLPDLLIGGPGDDDGGTYAGAAWLFYAGNLW